MVYLGTQKVRPVQQQQETLPVEKTAHNRPADVDLTKIHIHLVHPQI